MPIAQRQITVDSVRSLVRCAGPDDASQAVVFVHGNPGSSEDWEDLLARAGELGRAVAPDMPGYGKADRPKGFDYTVAGYSRHLQGLLEQLGIRRAHLVLHDFGGPWGLHWAAEHPSQVASVTLINTGLMRGYRWHRFARLWQLPVIGELVQLSATRVAFRMTLNAENPKPMPRAFVDRMYDDYDWGMKLAVLKLYRATRDADGMSRALAAKLAPLQLPALVVWGKGDHYVPYRFADSQRDAFAVEAVHVLEGCGHWPFIDEPELVAQLVMPFLKRQLHTIDGRAADH